MTRCSSGHLAEDTNTHKLVTQGQMDRAKSAQLRTEGAGGREGAVMAIVTCAKSRTGQEGHSSKIHCNCWQKSTWGRLTHSSYSARTSAEEAMEGRPAMQARERATAEGTTLQKQQETQHAHNPAPEQAGSVSIHGASTRRGYRRKQAGCRHSREEGNSQQQEDTPQETTARKNLQRRQGKRNQLAISASS